MNVRLGQLGRVIAISIMIGLVTACAGFESRYAKQLPAKPGSSVYINITADIPLNKARIFSQKGEVIPQSDIYKFDVYCSVLMHRLQTEDGPKLGIKPGKFLVTEVRLSNDETNMRRIFASREWFYDPPSRVNYETELRLQSVDQPDVRSLICVRQIDGIGNHYPRLVDFKRGFGSLVEFME